MRKYLFTVLFLTILVILAGCSGPTDADGDGLNATVEKENGLSDNTVDTDDDGLNDTREFRNNRLNGSNPDTDGDRLNDSKELAFGSNPSKVDTDGDGATDKQEWLYKSNPRAKHSDNDGIKDGVEIKHSASPTEVDTDEDGLSDRKEIRYYKTKPDDSDTDNDGLSDGRESHLRTSPRLSDTDGDGIPDKTEVNGVTNATKMDTDGDGLSDGVEAPPGPAESPFDPTQQDTDGDGLKDNVEYRIGTDPTVNDTDGDGRADQEEYHASGLNPTKREVRVKNSPQAGWENAKLQKEGLDAVEFLADLPQNRTERNETIVNTATTICNAHQSTVSEGAGNTTEVGKDLYRDTYRVANTAEALHDLGADINVDVVNNQMSTARRHIGLAEQYAPVFGSYNRLHNASCAVKRGEPGAKQDFYIASAEFAVDIALAKEGVIYKASFKTTGMAARTVGMNRLSRVCGWKCVGLVQSELHWLVRGTYSGALDTASMTAIEGNITVGGWNKSVRSNVGKYLANQTNATLIGGELVPEAKVVRCVNENIDPKDFPSIGFDLGGDVVDVLQKIRGDGKLPEKSDLSFLTEVDSVQNCLNE